MATGYAADAASARKRVLVQLIERPEQLKSLTGNSQFLRSNFGLPIGAL